MADPGGRRLSVVEFLGLGFVLMPLHTYPTVFSVRIVNKIHIVNVVCRLQLKYMHVTQSKFKTTDSTKVSNGGALLASGPGSAFVSNKGSVKDVFLNQAILILIQLL